MPEVFTRLRQLIDEAQVSRYQIAKETGVAQSQLSRFVNGEMGLRFEAAEAILDCLGYELAIVPKTETQPKAKKKPKGTASKKAAKKKRQPQK